jgi:hypothetical protein
LSCWHNVILMNVSLNFLNKWLFIFSILLLSVLAFYFNPVSEVWNSFVSNFLGIKLTFKSPFQPLKKVYLGKMSVQWFGTCLRKAGLDCCMTQVVEHLLRKREDLNSIPIPPKKKKKTQTKTKETLTFDSRPAT